MRHSKKNFILKINKLDKTVILNIEDILFLTLFTFHLQLNLNK